MTDSNGRYILVDGKPVEEPDLTKWGTFMEDASKRKVARDEYDSDIYVSTVFLGLDHSFGAGEPILYETMTFGDTPFDDEQERYSTREEALKGHAEACEKVAEYLKENK